MDALKISLPQDFELTRLFGVHDEYLVNLQNKFSASISLDSDMALVLKAPSDQIHSLSRLIKHMIELLLQQDYISEQEFNRLYDSVRRSEHSLDKLKKDAVFSFRGKIIRPQTLGQQAYVDALQHHTITFGLGPAGTGKTYLAMAYALSLLMEHKIGRIVLTRPVVEAGENLGFLPGTLEEKIDPYLRPLYDALHEMTDACTLENYLEQGVIEIAPLAFMRGRTFNDALVILDEAQNTTPEQMKMFLTRLGFGSKFIITGDTTQNDLSQKFCTLKQTQEILKDVKDICFCELDSRDVIRHSLVARIIGAYDAYHEEG